MKKSKKEKILNMVCENKPEGVDMEEYISPGEQNTEVKKKKKKKKNKQQQPNEAQNTEKEDPKDVEKEEPMPEENSMKKKKKKKKKLNTTEENEAVEESSSQESEKEEGGKRRKEDDEEEDNASKKMKVEEEKEEEVNGEGEVEAAGDKTTGDRSFASLRGLVSDETMRAVKKMGFKTMTEIQARSIPHLLEGRDLRGTAKTGSGKTLAFVIPIVELMHKLKFKPSNGTGVIIVSPTRELAMQTYGVLAEVMQGHSQTFALIVGGNDRKSDIQKLSKGMNIVVATPGRLLDHLQNTEEFMFKNTVCLVVDEADRIFDVGFEEQMKQMLRILPKQRQTILFSATKDDKTNEFAQMALKTEPLEVDVDCDKLDATVTGLQQAYLKCPTEKRFLVLYTFIKKYRKKKVMVFLSSCMSVKFHHELLNYIDVPVMCIHGKQKQVKRTSTFNQFSACESGVLLCTDVAARGWDIPAVDWIVQYDPPDDPREYIHRVGRTARAGGRGNALIFLREEELSFLDYLAAHKVTVENMDISWTKVANIQPQLEKLMSENHFLHLSAKEAFKGFVRAYHSHQLKDAFNINSLDLKKVAKTFGFAVTPYIDLGVSSNKTQERRVKNYGLQNQKQARKVQLYRHGHNKKRKA